MPTDYPEFLPFSLTLVKPPGTFRLFTGEDERLVEINVDAAGSTLEQGKLLKVLWALRGIQGMSDVHDVKRAMMAVQAGMQRVGPEDEELYRACLISDPEPRPVLIPLDDVTATEVEWLWPDRVAVGKVSMLAGDPGLGKSFLTLDMAARVSTGSPWPDCPDFVNKAGSVVLLNCEDDLSDTVRPRLDRAGADCTRIVALHGVLNVNREGKTSERSFSLDCDIPRLDRAIRKVPGCRLVVIDPITAYLGQADSHNNAEIRALLAPLAEMANHRRVAVVCVSHLNKGAGPAMYRTMGSLAFVAAARSAWAVIKDKDDPLRRLVMPIKNNVGPDDTGLAYRLIDDRVQWERDPVAGTAEEVMRANEITEPDHEPVGQTSAGNWLQGLLAAGPMLALEIRRQAGEAAIPLRTLERAKKRLGVQAYRQEITGPWYWRLAPPEPVAEAAAPTPPPAAPQGPAL
jgi:hypothetical protein